MSLSKYQEKRKFQETPEPEGKAKASKGALRFVVQKHDASHLHYDFRLEMDGVLKSWAVPKGPSLNPEDKRLAMMVEDHPYDYRTFEGIIPEGNYGAGTVMVWDEGTYELLEGEKLTRKEQEKQLLKQLADGNLKLNLHGHKLNGAFALFLMKGRGERSWILVKKEDAFASKAEVISKDRSVKSKKTLKTIAAENGTELNHPEGPAATEKKGEAKPPKLKLIDPAATAEKRPASKKVTAKKTSSKTKAVRKSAAGKTTPRTAASKKKLK